MDKPILLNSHWVRPSSIEVICPIITSSRWLEETDGSGWKYTVRTKSGFLFVFSDTYKDKLEAHRQWLVGVVFNNEPPDADVNINAPELTW